MKKLLKMFPSFPGRKMNRVDTPNVTASDIMKLPLPTIIGIVITVLAKFLGAETGEVRGVWDGVLELWPIWTGILADAGSFWTTVRSSTFDKAFWKQKTFWLQLVSGVTVIIGAFGIDVSGAQPLVDKVLANGEAVMALVGSALVVFGRFRLKFQKPKKV